MDPGMASTDPRVTAASVPNSHAPVPTPALAGRRLASSGQISSSSGGDEKEGMAAAGALNGDNGGRSSSGGDEKEGMAAAGALNGDNGGRGEGHLYPRPLPQAQPQPQLQRGGGPECSRVLCDGRGLSGGPAAAEAGV